MRIYQCGFLSSKQVQGISESSNSVSEREPCQLPWLRDPSPVEGDGQNMAEIYDGGWGFTASRTNKSNLYVWGNTVPTTMVRVADLEIANASKLNECSFSGTTKDTLNHSKIVCASFGFDEGLVVLETRDNTLEKSCWRVLFLTAVKHMIRLQRLALQENQSIIAVSCGEQHMLALTQDGTVLARGVNTCGQLGIKTNSVPGLLECPTGLDGSDCFIPVESLRPVRIVSIAAGAKHSVALSETGQVWAWGCCLHGQCGTGSINKAVPLPHLVSSMGPLCCTSVSAGLFHTLCCTDLGDVYSWGGNQDGALGIGSFDTHLEPVLVDCLGENDRIVKKVSAGARHSLALCQNGDVYSFGCGKFGQLGVNVKVSNAPLKVKIPSAAVDIAAGWAHSLFLVKDQ
jgi:alpha-tubulin suppressor-like RCC1 family protein